MPAKKDALTKVLDKGERTLRRRKEGVDSVRAATFCRELVRTPIVGIAARRAGISIKAALREREKNETFREAWDLALRGSIDSVEQILIEKAHAGDLKAIEKVLKAYRPERYRERHEVAVVADSTIEVNLVPMVTTVVTPEE